MVREPSASRFPSGSPELPYEVAKHKVDLQLSQVDGLDNKIAITMGFSFTNITILLAVVALRPNVLDRWLVGLLLLSGTATVAVIYLALRAYWIKTYFSTPPIDEVWENIGKYQRGESIMWWAAETYKKAAESNEKLVNEKAELVKHTQMSFVMQAAISIITLVVILFRV